MSNANEYVGHRVGEIIKSKGMTKRFVSDQSGMPYSSLNSKIKGYRSITIDDILAIAEVTHEPPSSFLPPQFVAASAVTPNTASIPA